MFKLARPLAALVAPIALIATLGTLAAPAHAQRAITVPATSGWKHAETGLILGPRIAGLTRGEIKDSGAAELDITAQYASADGLTSVTLYLFRPALDSVPVWFDRSETQILVRGTYGKAAPLAGAQPFAPPNATTASALRRIYVPSKGPYKSTGLAMMPLGRWLVAVRISSTAIEPARLDAAIAEIVAGIGWPEGVAESPAAAVVVSCHAPLPYAGRAKMRKPGMADGLLGGMMTALGTSELGVPKDAALLCRDLPPRPEFGVYRDPGSTNTYVMAMGDAGIVIRILPELGGKTGSMVFAGFLDHNSIYPPFEKLPHPDDVMQALRTTAPLAQASLDGKTIQLSMPAQ